MRRFNLFFLFLYGMFIIPCYGKDVLIYNDVKLEQLKKEQNDIKNRVKNKTNKHNILLTGASFAHNSNPWFQMLCETLNIHGCNKAISGTTILDTAKRMSKGQLYTSEEFDDFTILMIMHTHNYAIDSLTGKTPDVAAISKAWEYVLTTYRRQCFEVQFNPSSRWYGNSNGEPCIIVVLTHWHDGREDYNNSIRRLQKRKDFLLCELDKNIGFDKIHLNPSTGKQFSIQYALNTEKINGVVFGWHPQRDKNVYIQQKIMNIVAYRLLDIN